jgi:formamidopyrimidine-DNA glycosylase
MPELPEVEIVKRSLSKMVNNAKIINIKINNRNLRYKLPITFRKELINEKIVKVSRRSKYLILHLKKKILLLHLGMTGKLLIMRSQDNQMFKTSFYYDLNILPQHNHVYFALNNGLVIIYNDVRRFGFFKVYSKKKLNEIIFLKNLGTEPLASSLNTKYFNDFIKNKKKNVKNLLMDQTFICGLGNIYVNEVLFLTKIHPERISASLNCSEVEKLINNIRLILKLAISRGGSSIRDFQNTSGKNGNFQRLFRVYGKENKNCSRISCGGKIKKKFISSRSSFYCNKCQN